MFPFYRWSGKGYSGNNLQSQDSESGLIVNEVSFHDTTAPSGAKIDSGNYYKQLWKNYLKVVHQ